MRQFYRWITVWFGLNTQEKNDLFYTKIKLPVTKKNIELQAFIEKP